MWYKRHMRMGITAGTTRPGLVKRVDAKLRHHPPLSLLVGLVLLGLVVVADAVAPPALGFLALYIAPVLLVAWYRGGPAGLVMTALATFAWVAGHDTPVTATDWWNTGGSFAVLLFAAVVTAGMRRARAEARHAARTDALTGVSNQRGFAERAARELARARRQGYPIALAYLDVDDFKQVNDTLGHATGDTLLRLLAETVSMHLRPYDILARLGGDEFALLLPMTGHEEAELATARIRAAVHDALGREGWPATVSVGVLICRTPPDTLDALVDQADALMYAAKRAGKDRIAVMDWCEVDLAHTAAPRTPPTHRLTER